MFGKEVTLHIYGLDKNGRTIADVLLPDGTNVNHELVRDHWWYRKYTPRDTAFYCTASPAGSEMVRGGRPRRSLNV